MESRSLKRLQGIVGMLKEKGFVKGKDLAELYNVSMETIRKDLIYLEEKGIVKKEYGGASLAMLGIEESIEFRMHREEEKREIARCIAGILKDYHSMILDSGSTCQACVQYINLLPEMDIVINSVDICKQLNGDHHNVFMLPGRKREKNSALIGSWTETYLKGIQVDVCILGTSGIMDSSGPSSHSYQEIATKRQMMEQSDMVYVLADSSKFREKGLHTICQWKQIDGIITDHNISTKNYNEFRKKVPIYILKENT